jgi:hypothetical protein
VPELVQCQLTGPSGGLDRSGDVQRRLADRGRVLAAVLEPNNDRRPWEDGAEFKGDRQQVTISTDCSQFLGRTSAPPWRAPHDPLDVQGVRLEPRRPPRSRTAGHHEGDRVHRRDVSVPLQPPEADQARGGGRLAKGGALTANPGPAGAVDTGSAECSRLEVSPIRRHVAGRGLGTSHRRNRQAPQPREWQEADHRGQDRGPNLEPNQRARQRAAAGGRRYRGTKPGTNPRRGWTRARNSGDRGRVGHGASERNSKSPIKQGGTKPRHALRGTSLPSVLAVMS